MSCLEPRRPPSGYETANFYVCWPGHHSGQTRVVLRWLEHGGLTLVVERNERKRERIGKKEKSLGRKDKETTGKKGWPRIGPRVQFSLASHLFFLNPQTSFNPFFGLDLSFSFQICLKTFHFDSNIQNFFKLDPNLNFYKIYIFNFTLYKIVGFYILHSLRKFCPRNLKCSTSTNQTNSDAPLLKISPLHLSTSCA